MDQFEEIPLLEILLNFHKDACRPNICHIPSKCYHFTCKMANNVMADLEFCNSRGQTQW